MTIYVRLTWTMDCRLIFLSDFLFLFLQHHGVHCWPFWKGGECSEKQQLVKHDMRDSGEKRLLPCIGTTAFSHCDPDKVDNLNSICAVAGIIFHDLRSNVRWKTFVWCHYVWNVYLTTASHWSSSSAIEWMHGSATFINFSGNRSWLLYNIWRDRTLHLSRLFCLLVKFISSFEFEDMWRIPRHHRLRWWGSWEFHHCKV